MKLVCLCYKLALKSKTVASWFVGAKKKHRYNCSPSRPGSIGNMGTWEHAAELDSIVHLVLVLQF